MKTLLNLYYRFLQILLASLMGLLMVPVSMQIFSRYIGLIPRYIWTEEIARFCFIWIILIGAIIAVRDGAHFAVDLLPTPKTRWGEFIGHRFVDLGILFVAVIFIVWGVDLVEFGWNQESEIAELWMVTIFIAWPVAGVSWIVFLIENLVKDLKLLRSSD